MGGSLQKPSSRTGACIPEQTLVNVDKRPQCRFPETVVTALLSHGSRDSIADQPYKHLSMLGLADA